jgi:hypothetical protein
MNPNIVTYSNAGTPGSTGTAGSEPSTDSSTGTYDDLTKELWSDLRIKLSETSTEIVQRNATIADRDAYIYGDKLKQSLDIPVGHDFTPVNWLKRTIEIHKTQFMGRPFSIISTYNNQDLATAQDDNDKKRLQIENKKQKTNAEMREETIKNIIRDNGGHSLFMEGAESGGVVGNWIVKTWYDEDEKKFTISPVEAVENCYVVWSKDDFRQHDMFAYVYQVSKDEAMSEYGVKDTVATSPLGMPLDVLGTTPQTQMSSQPMVSIFETTGKLPGWCSTNGRVAKCKAGNETEMNLLFAGNELQRVIDDSKKLPNYYIFANKKARRRAWGLSDITDAAINLNLTYIETLSDWRTVSAKVNFPKFKFFNFGPDVQMPKFKSRSIQGLPLSDGQDISELHMGDTGKVDFQSQLAEIKEQFVRETGTAQVLLDNSGVSMNSNQALITSMKPTSDIAENKKELWSPVLIRMFSDAIETLAAYEPDTYKDLADDKDPWVLRVQWPSTTQKEDPIYQQMLLNRWHAGTMSLQSYLEAQGESNEEVDRIRDEMTDMLTAAIHARELGMFFNINFMPSPSTMPPKINVNLRGDLDPNQTGNLAWNHGFNGGPNDPNAPFPTSAGPTGYEGMKANDNAMNQGFISGQFPNEKPNQKGPDGKSVSSQVTTPANNQPGTGAVSQPGSGAPAVTPQGAINQTSQNMGH